MYGDLVELWKSDTNRIELVHVVTTLCILAQHSTTKPMFVFFVVGGFIDYI